MTHLSGEEKAKLTSLRQLEKVWIDGKIIEPLRENIYNNEDYAEGKKRTSSPTVNPTLSPSTSPSIKPTLNPILGVVYVRFSMWAGLPENDDSLLEKLKNNSLENTFMNYRYQSLDANEVYSEGSRNFLEDLKNILRKILCRHTDFKLVTNAITDKDSCPDMSMKRKNIYVDSSYSHPTVILSNQAHNNFYLEDKVTTLPEYHNLELKWTEFKIEFPVLHVAPLYGAMAKEEERKEGLENHYESIVDPILQVQKVANTAVENSIKEGEFDIFLRKSNVQSKYNFIVLSSPVGAEEDVFVPKLTNEFNLYKNSEPTESLFSHPLDTSPFSPISTTGLILFVSTSLFVIYLIKKSNKRARKRREQDEWNMINHCMNGPLSSYDGLDHILKLPINDPTISTKCYKSSVRTLDETNYDVEDNGSIFLPGGIEVADEPPFSRDDASYEKI